MNEDDCQIFMFYTDFVKISAFLLHFIEVHVYVYGYFGHFFVNFHSLVK